MCTPACVLLSVEPDEIDLAGEETGADEAGEAGETGASGSASGGEDGDTSNEGDSDSDPGGDGDGDPATSSDGGTEDTGAETDGTGSGDGDGDDGGDSGGAEACEELVSDTLELGLTPIELAGASGFTSMCGGEGPELWFSYTSVGDAAYSLALLDANFDASLALVTNCDPLEELSCTPSPEPLLFDLVDGESIYILVDALLPEGGQGTLELSQL